MPVLNYLPAIASTTTDDPRSAISPIIRASPQLMPQDLTVPTALDVMGLAMANAALVQVRKAQHVVELP